MLNFSDTEFLNFPCNWYSGIYSYARLLSKYGETPLRIMIVGNCPQFPNEDIH